MNDKPERMPNVPPFVKFVCANVPMVFDDSLSYYEALCALWKYVSGMTDVINNNATLEEEYIEKFNELNQAFNDLKTWVETYFDNLDVQEEINNKLDEMAEQGVLADIISQYLNSIAIFGYDTVADMKDAENLIDGSYARTLGYYAKNDGGGATYKIRNITNDDVIDEAFIIEMNDSGNALIAELIIDEPLDLRQLGCKNDGVTDNHDVIQEALNRGLSLFVGEGIYYCDGNLTLQPEGVTITGVHNPLYYVEPTDGVLKFSGSGFDRASAVFTGLTLQNVAIVGSGTVGEEWDNTHGLKDIRATISKCSIKGFKYGIEHCGNLNIGQSHIFQNYIGIYQTGDSIIHDNDIYSNESDGYQTNSGIALNTINNNRFEWNGGVGVHIEGSNHNTIMCNVFDRNGLEGILIYNCTRNSVIGNLLKRNYASSSEVNVDHANLRIDTAYNTMVSNNTLIYAKQNDGGTGSNVPSTGLRMKASHNCYIIGNDLYNGGVDEPLSRNDVTGSIYVEKDLQQSVGSAATDAASTQTLANNLRTALITIGLVKQ